MADETTERAAPVSAGDQPTYSMTQAERDRIYGRQLTADDEINERNEEWARSLHGSNMRGN